MRVDSVLITFVNSDKTNESDRTISVQFKNLDSMEMYDTRVLIVTSLVLFCTARIEARAPLLVISFDGLQAGKFDEWLQKTPSSNFGKFINEGTKAEYMVPSFPAVSWPNHMTMVTGKQARKLIKTSAKTAQLTGFWIKGLYPESHGIIGNVLYDPVYDVVVNFLNGDYFDDPRMWNMSEPVWLTAKKQVTMASPVCFLGSLGLLKLLTIGSLFERT